MIDAVPTWVGGEPTGMPERPANAAEFPAVNDRPPPRDTKLITEEEQAKLERELTAAQAAQVVQAQTDGIPPPKPKLTAAQAKAAQARNKQKNPPPD